MFLLGSYKNRLSRVIRKGCTEIEWLAKRFMKWILKFIKLFSPPNCRLISNRWQKLWRWLKSKFSYFIVLISQSWTDDSLVKHTVFKSWGSHAPPVNEWSMPADSCDCTYVYKNKIRISIAITSDQIILNKIYVLALSNHITMEHNNICKNVNSSLLQESQ